MTSRPPCCVCPPEHADPDVCIGANCAFCLHGCPAPRVFVCCDPFGAVRDV